MIVVTGGAGFIGGNLIAALNHSGRNDILAVDHLDEIGDREVDDLQVAEWLDATDLLDRLDSGRGMDGVEAILHQGACTDTTELNWDFLEHNNYEYSRRVLDFCLDRRVPLIYASSAAVYGRGPGFSEDPANENPLNPYARSKVLFDDDVREVLPDAQSQIVGLRYFNVYGPGERHKGRMASVVFHFNRQLLDAGMVRLFEGSGGYADGEQRRDFVYVGDIVRVTGWLLRHPTVSGIFNLGTGRSRSFNAVARAVIAGHGSGRIEYIPFPAELIGRYQDFTEADMRALRAAGFRDEFTDLETGIAAYLDWLRSG